MQMESQIKTAPTIAPTHSSGTFSREGLSSQGPLIQLLEASGCTSPVLWTAARTPHRYDEEKLTCHTSTNSTFYLAALGGEGGGNITLAGFIILLRACHQCRISSTAYAAYLSCVCSKALWIPSSETACVTFSNSFKNPPLNAQRGNRVAPPAKHLLTVTSL